MFSDSVFLGLGNKRKQERFSRSLKFQRKEQWRKLSFSPSNINPIPHLDKKKRIGGQWPNFNLPGGLISIGR